MEQLILEDIKSIRSLPNTIKEIDFFRKSNNSNLNEFLSIIKKEPYIIDNIIKISNSNIFGKRFNKNNIINAIELIGLKIILTISIGSIIIKTINKNLFSYAVTNDDFLYSNSLSLIFLDKWLSKDNVELRDDLLLSSFLQECGKFIISEVIQRTKQTELFLKNLVDTNDINQSELIFTGYTCSRITANIFRHWNFSHNIVLPIGYSQDFENCPIQILKKAQILNILKILCDVRNPLNDNCIEKALNKVLEHKLNVNNFLFTLDSLRQEIYNNSKL